WVRVSDDIGFPAGLRRTMIADLSKRLQPGDRRVRIGTNLNIYWDQILIDTSPQEVRVETHEIPLAQASLAFRGYPRRIEGRVRKRDGFLRRAFDHSGTTAVPCYAGISVPGRNALPYRSTPPSISAEYEHSGGKGTVGSVKHWRRGL